MDEIITQWNGAAKAYLEHEAASPYAAFCREFLRDCFGDLTGQSAFDAGCGGGDAVAILAEKGARAVGCDASELMLHLARERFPGLQFDLANLQGRLPYTDGQFDIALCNLVLMDIDPIDSAVAELCRVLRPGGSLLWSIVHPAFYRAPWERDAEGKVVAKRVTAYITEQSERQDFWGETMHYHRPLSFYLNKMAGAGLSLRRMEEPAVYEEAKIPDIPLYLFAEFTKL